MHWERSRPQTAVWKYSNNIEINAQFIERCDSWSILNLILWYESFITQMQSWFLSTQKLLYYYLNINLIKVIIPNQSIYPKISFFKYASKKEVPLYKN